MFRLISRGSFTLRRRADLFGGNRSGRGRRIRRGHDVVIELTVGTDGRVHACRITDPSPDPEADAITCRLATERFVFRPRLDGAGEPVVGTFRWRQRWF